MTAIELISALSQTEIPVFYGRSIEGVKPPYLVYLGDGQEQFNADNTFYKKSNSYRIEYYFTEKNETIEETIESALLAEGWLYSKSEDIYIESEDVFEIYYQI